MTLDASSRLLSEPDSMDCQTDVEIRAKFANHVQSTPLNNDAKLSVVGVSEIRKHQTVPLSKAKRTSINPVDFANTQVLR